MKLHQVARFALCAAMVALCLAGWRRATVQPVAGQTSNQPALHGAAALDQLKQTGQYESLQAALKQARFTVSRATHTPLGRPAWHAPNPAAGYDAYVTEAGVSIALSAASYVSLSLRGAGYGAALQAIAPGAVSGDQQAIKLTRAGVVQEWYANGEAGLEQGFTLSTPPGARQTGVPLRLALQVSAGWRAVASEDGRLITLLSQRQGEAVEYSKLVARDSLGRNLPARLTVADEQVVIEVDDISATYPLTIDPIFNLQQMLVAADPSVEDTLGWAVALSGNTALIGAPYDDVTGADQGSAYVFVRNGTSWTQQARLNAVDGAAGDLFGYTVALSGDTALIGALLGPGVASVDQGAAYIFVRSGTSWSQQTRLTAGDGALNDFFGSAVALEGNTALIGARLHPVGANAGQGAAYIFVRSGAVWTFQQQLTANDGAVSDQFGTAAALSGETALIGALGDNVGANTDQGSAYVFTRSGTTWSQQQRLNAAGGAAGDLFGNAVALSGETALVGAFQAAPGGSAKRGAAYVFTRAGTAWTQQQQLLAGDGAAGGQFGIAVALSGDTAVVGATLGLFDPGTDQRSAYVFARNGVVWSQQRQLGAEAGTANDRFGYAVALSGDTVLVGAFLGDASLINQGVAYIFVLCNNNHVEQQQLTANDGAANDVFGSSVALSGDTVVVGAPFDEIGANSNQGSAYVFTRSGTTWNFQQKLLASDGAASDEFGRSVALSGDTAVVGAFGDDIGANTQQGSAYVFTRSGTFWTQQQPKLMASDGAAFDLFGYSVALSGDTAVVAAYGDDNARGSAYVFTRSGTVWTQQAKLTAIDGAATDFFGISVALSSDTVLVGACFDEIGTNAKQGSAYVFVRSGTVWTQQQKLTASDGTGGDLFGISVALSGDAAVVGADEDFIGANADQGSAYVFVHSGTVWTQQQKLTAPDGAASDFFGNSVALSGDTVVVGAIGDDIGTNGNQGSAYVFTRSGTVWTQQQKLTASDGAALDDFGGSVALSGDTVVVGAKGDNIGANDDQGSAYVFVCPACPTITLNPASLPNGMIGTSYNQSVTASGGTGPVQFSLSSGALPPGLSLGQNGLLAGTPALTGTYSFTLTATLLDSLCPGSRSYTLTVTPPCSPITVNPANPALPDGTTGQAYNQTFSASGGNPAYTFTVSAGVIPNGVTLNVNTGALSGNPTTVGSFTFTIKATDAQACMGTREYTVDITSPTLARLKAFTATGYDEGVSLEWQTGFEVDNLGFHIYRDEAGKRTQLNPQLVAGSALVAGSVAIGAGRSYSWWDGGIADCGTRIGDCQNAQYWLEDVDLNGVSTWHGPVYIAKASGALPEYKAQQAKLLSTVGTSAQLQSAFTPVETTASLPQATETNLLAQKTIASSAAVKLAIKQEGWYRVTREELLEAGLAKDANPRNLQLFVDRVEQAMLVVGEESGSLESFEAIEFYGTGTGSPYSTQRTYWLVAGSQPGRRIPVVNTKPDSKGAESFPFTVERRERSIYFSSLLNGDAENWFGGVVTSTAIDQPITIRSLDEAAQDEAELEIALQGVTSLAQSPDHRVEVRVNGQFIGHLFFDGREHKVERFAVPLAMLKEGENLVTLRAKDNTDVSLIDNIRLTYPHKYNADDDSLRLTTAATSRSQLISGFTSNEIRVFDVTDATNVFELTGVIEPSSKTSFSVAVGAQMPNRALLALTTGQFKKPASITANHSSSLRQENNSADFVIITRRQWMDQLEPLKALRQKQGLVSMLVDIEDIFDEFSFGQKTPYAVRSFLSYAHSNWKRKPRFILFAGDASLDPRNYTGLGETDFVPAKLVDTTFLETASDDWLADFDEDGFADLVAGRLPIGTAKEASVMVNKLLSYELAPPSSELVLFADLGDGFDFESASLQLRPLIPGSLRVLEFFRSRNADATTKAMLLDAVNRGQRIVNYAGHGSTSNWRGDMLTAADARALTNAGRLPLFVMMNCLNGYFQDPLNESLAEALIRNEHGGAVAVWASSGMTFPSEQALMNQRLYRTLFGKTNLTLGEQVSFAKLATADADVRRSWILFGDPTLRLK